MTLNTGKTILASSVVDEARKLPGVHVAFFYCRYLDNGRSTFLAVMRGILSQLLFQDEALLIYLYEKVSTSGEVSLSTESVAKEVVETSIKNFQKLYIVIDGIDECEREERKQIVAFFQDVWESLPQDDSDALRCMFVSQDDNIARNDFKSIPSLKISEADNKGDISAYAVARSSAIQTKHKLSDDRRRWLQELIVARAEGKTIF